VIASSVHTSKRRRRDVLIDSLACQCAIEQPLHGGALHSPVVSVSSFVAPLIASRFKLTSHQRLLSALHSFPYTVN